MTPYKPACRVTSRAGHVVMILQQRARERAKAVLAPANALEKRPITGATRPITFCLFSFYL